MNLQCNDITMIADQNIFFDNCLAHTIFVTVFRNSASRSRAGMVAIYIILPLRKSLLSHHRSTMLRILLLQTFWLFLRLSLSMQFYF